MYWNHRVFKRYYDDFPGDGPYYTLHEVYYDDEDDSIIGYVADDKPAWGESIDELKQVLNWMLDACDKPIIDSKELDKYFEERRLELEANPPEEEEYVVYNSIEELLEDLENGE